MVIIDGDNKGQVSMDNIMIPDPESFPELREGTQEYEARKYRLQIWQDFDSIAYKFMIEHNLPMQFRLDCFELIKKYDLQPERSKREDLANSIIDSQKKIWDSVDIDQKFTEQDFEKAKIRCSEQYSNMLREVQ